MIIPNKDKLTEFTLTMQIGDFAEKEHKIKFPTRIFVLRILQTSPQHKLLKIKRLSESLEIDTAEIKTSCKLLECKRIVDTLTEEYDLDNIYRLRLVE